MQPLPIDWSVTYTKVSLALGQLIWVRRKLVKGFELEPVKLDCTSEVWTEAVALIAPGVVHINPKGEVTIPTYGHALFTPNSGWSRSLYPLPAIPDYPLPSRNAICYRDGGVGWSVQVAHGNAEVAEALRKDASSMWNAGDRFASLMHQATFPRS